jgi:hypothetical protein
MTRPLPVCADESVHAAPSLAALVGKYDAVNIKLDKAGGLTEALAMASEAERLGFGIMAGCMVATSLAMAPATVAQRARVVDLDGRCSSLATGRTGFATGEPRAPRRRRRCGATEDRAVRTVIYPRSSDKLAPAYAGACPESGNRFSGRTRQT